MNPSSQYVVPCFSTSINIYALQNINIRHEIYTFGAIIFYETVRRNLKQRPFILIFFAIRLDCEMGIRYLNHQRIEPVGRIKKAPYNIKL